MSSVRVVVLLLLALVIGAGAVLIIEGNAGPVSLHVGGFPAQVNLSL